ncbi:hypothetical protein YPPY53_0544, partial [Yersinia pestis PY-53]
MKKNDIIDLNATIVNEADLN